MPPPPIPTVDVSEVALQRVNELGIWRVEEKIEYRRIMLVQNIMKSDNKRLCKRILLEQQEEDEDDDTLYATTRKTFEQYGIDIQKIAEMRKSQLKKMVKEKINEKMRKMIQKAAESMTKLRFLKGEIFERKKYLNEMGGYDSQQTIKTRLNMQPVYHNYKADIKLKKHCPYCLCEEDNTEHLLECKELGRTMLTLNRYGRADTNEAMGVRREQSLAAFGQESFHTNGRHVHMPNDLIS